MSIADEAGRVDSTLSFLQSAAEQCPNQQYLQAVLLQLIMRIQWNQLRNASLGNGNKEAALNGILVTLDNANRIIAHSEDQFTTGNHFDLL